MARKCVAHRGDVTIWIGEDLISRKNEVGVAGAFAMKEDLKKLGGNWHPTDREWKFPSERASEIIDIVKRKAPMRRDQKADEFYKL